MATAFTVSNESKPNTAIRAIDAGGGDAAPDIAYTIKITGTIDLTSVPTGLKPNRLQSRTETITRPPHLLSAIRLKRFRRSASPKHPRVSTGGPPPTSSGGGLRPTHRKVQPARSMPCRRKNYFYQIRLPCIAFRHNLCLNVNKL
jgi:hypothetical protein